MLDWIGPVADRAWYWMLVCVLLGLGVVEAVRPARPVSHGVGVRWFTNIGLQAANSVILTVLAPAEAAAVVTRLAGIDWHPVAHLAAVAGDFPALVLGLLMLDLYAYGMHRLQHHVFVLWRLHAVHHADVDLDVSTTLRHHPVEVLVSTAAGGVLFGLLGIPEWIFPLYALLGIVCSLAQHANVGRAGRVDRALRTVFVTPGLHQIHHSVEVRDHDANFGTVFSFWDRLFGSYRAEPALGRAAMTFGVAPFTGPGYAQPHWGLLLPFAIKRSRRDAASGEAGLPQPVQDQGGSIGGEIRA